MGICDKLTYILTIQHSFKLIHTNRKDFEQLMTRMVVGILNYETCCCLLFARARSFTFNKFQAQQPQTNPVTVFRGLRVILFLLT